MSGGRVKYPTLSGLRMKTDTSIWYLRRRRFDLVPTSRKTASTRRQKTTTAGTAQSVDSTVGKNSESIQFSDSVLQKCKWLTV